MIKELAILLTAKNMASGPINKVSGDIGRMDRIAGRAGAGVRTLGRNLAFLGAGAAIAGIGAVRSGLESLAERENVIASTAAAIAATGGAAKVSAPQIRNWSEELERATGAAIDDKAIQASANVLLRVTSITEANFKRTLAAALDLGAGLKTGPEAGARTLAKALADPVKGMTALRRAGVVLTESEQDRIKALIKGNKLQEAQNALLLAVESRYKGAAAASAGPYQRALNMLADATEDAKMALAEGFLPVLEKVADKLSMALADPKTMADIRGLGQGLASAFDAVLAASSNIPWGSIGDAMRLAGAGAKIVLDMFTGLPPWVQTAVLTGWGLNKLTGGALGGIAGELAKGLFSGRGATPANPLFVADVAGGVGGVVPGGKTGGGGGVLGNALRLTGVGLVTIAGLEVGSALSGINDPRHQRPDGKTGRLSSTTVRATFGEPQGPPTPNRGTRGGATRGSFGMGGVRLDRTATFEASAIARASAAGLKPTADQITRTAAATMSRADTAAANAFRAGERNTNRIVAAIQNIVIPPTTVTVRSVVTAMAQANRVTNAPLRGAVGGVGID